MSFFLSSLHICMSHNNHYERENQAAILEASHEQNTILNYYNTMTVIFLDSSHFSIKYYSVHSVQRRRWLLDSWLFAISLYLYYNMMIWYDYAMPALNVDQYYSITSIILQLKDQRICVELLRSYFLYIIIYMTMLTHEYYNWLINACAMRLQLWSIIRSAASDFWYNND